MLDVLLDAGADINAKSDWWAGGFSLLDTASSELAAHAIRRGATVTVHAAARLGMSDQLRTLIEADPDLVNARGGDGQTPLHFAATTEIAAYLLDHGADIDARDVDHESTPAQYALGERPEIARYLISRGAQTDILMAASLNDTALAEKHLRENPESIRTRVSEEYFPMVGGKNGGTIYQWKFGWHVSAVQIAQANGHTDLFQFLLDRCPPDEKLLNACWLHDEPLVRSLILTELTPAVRRHLAHAARNNNTAAARLMLEAGFPLDTWSQHHATPLHWAAWHGNAELVRLFLPHNPPLENADNDFKGTPLGWAIHGSENGWYLPKGDHAAAVEALLNAGAKPPEKAAGAEPVRAVLRRYGIA